jgi:hypothetical protein
VGGGECAGGKQRLFLFVFNAFNLSGSKLFENIEVKFPLNKFTEKRVIPTKYIARTQKNTPLLLPKFETCDYQQSYQMQHM